MMIAGHTRDLFNWRSPSSQTQPQSSSSHLKVVAVVVGSGDSDGGGRSGGDGASYAEARAGNSVLSGIDAVVGIFRDSGGDDGSSADIKNTTLSSASGLVIDSESDGAEASYVSFSVPSSQMLMYMQLTPGQG